MGDRALAVCVILGALAYLYADIRIPSSDIGDPLGPKAFPALIGAGLLLSGLWLLVENRRKRPQPVSTGPTPLASQWPVLAAMLAWTALYYASLEPIGYLPTTVVYLLGLLSYFHRGKIIANIAIAVAFTAITWGVFSKLLHVSMPPGVMPV
jgi:putative tricarboxylic transport membrane protein